MHEKKFDFLYKSPSTLLNCTPINTALINELGIIDAFVLTTIINIYYDSELDNAISEDGFFRITYKKLEEKTKLNGYLQRKSLANLTKRGFIECKILGSPAKRYCRII